MICKLQVEISNPTTRIPNSCTSCCVKKPSSADISETESGIIELTKQTIKQKNIIIKQKLKNQTKWKKN